MNPVEMNQKANKKKDNQEDIEKREKESRVRRINTKQERKTNKIWRRNQWQGHINHKKQKRRK